MQERKPKRHWLIYPGLTILLGFVIAALELADEDRVGVFLGLATIAGGVFEFPRARRELRTGESSQSPGPAFEHKFTSFDLGPGTMDKSAGRTRIERL
jgi:hypothetical protein